MKFNININGQFDTDSGSLVIGSVTSEPAEEPQPEPEAPTPEPEPTPPPVEGSAPAWQLEQLANDFEDVWEPPPQGSINPQATQRYSSGAKDPITGDIPYRYEDGRPLSAHTYSGCAIIGDYLYSSRYSPYNPDGGGNGRDWRLKLITGEWEELPLNPQGPGAIAINVKGVLHLFGKDGLCRLNFDDTWTNAKYASGKWLDTSQPLYGCGDYDRESDVVVINSLNGMRVWRVNDITDAELIKPEWSGNTEIVGLPKGAVFYSEHYGCNVAYHPGAGVSSIFLIDPVNYVIRRVDFDGAPAVPDMSNEGIYRKMWMHGRRIRYRVSTQELWSVEV